MAVPTHGNGTGDATREAGAASDGGDCDDAWDGYVAVVAVVKLLTVGAEAVAAAHVKSKADPTSRSRRRSARTPQPVKIPQCEFVWDVERM